MGNARTYLILLVVVLVLAILALYAGVEWGEKKLIVDGVVGAVAGALIGAAVAIVLLWVGFEQLRVGITQLQKISESAVTDSKTSSADLILRLTTRFFKPETRILVHLLDSDYLEFVANSPFEDSYFRVNETLIGNSGLADEIKERLLVRKTYSTFDIDDLLLGQLEDLGDLEKAGTLDIGMIHNASATTWNLFQKTRKCDPILVRSRPMTKAPTISWNT